jgi:hypothetical protein
MLGMFKEGLEIYRACPSDKRAFDVVDLPAKYFSGIAARRPFYWSSRLEFFGESCL